MPLQAPSDQFDRKIGEGTDFVWPAASYVGRIENAELRPFPDWMGPNAEGTNGLVSDDGETLGVQIGSVNPLEQIDAEVGNRKVFVPNDRNNIVVRDGDLTLEDVDLSADVSHWKLQNGLDYVMRLAKGLGIAQRSNGRLIVPDGFVDDLVGGTFDEMEIGFEINHLGTYTDREGNEKVDWQVVDFFEPV